MFTWLSVPLLQEISCSININRKQKNYFLIGSKITHHVNHCFAVLFYIYIYSSARQTLPHSIHARKTMSSDIVPTSTTSTVRRTHDQNNLFLDYFSHEIIRVLSESWAPWPNFVTPSMVLTTTGQKWDLTGPNSGTSCVSSTMALCFWSNELFFPMSSMTHS